MSTTYRDAAPIARPTWEYFLLEWVSGDIRDASAALNRLGADGWEVVGVHHRSTDSKIIYTLKRLRA